MPVILKCLWNMLAAEAEAADRYKNAVAAMLLGPGPGLQDRCQRPTEAFRAVRHVLTKLSAQREELIRLQSGSISRRWFVRSEGEGRLSRRSAVVSRPAQASESIGGVRCSICNDLP